MNSQGIRWLQWAYPLALWFAVAIFTVLACKNIIASPWQPDQPVLVETEVTTPVAYNGTQVFTSVAQLR